MVTENGVSSVLRDFSAVVSDFWELQYKQEQDLMKHLEKNSRNVVWLIFVTSEKGSKYSLIFFSFFQGSIFGLSF